MRRSGISLALAVVLLLAPSALAVGGVSTPICRHRGLAVARPSGPGSAGEATRGCERPLAGAVADPPADLYSHGGRLAVRLDYLSSVDGDGRTLFCFVTPDGIQSPTLHVRPGDTLDLVLTNRTAPQPAGADRMAMGHGLTVCGDATADASSVNIHFHGTSVAAVCHADDVIHTSVNAGQTFAYHLTIPRNQPPGLYWYHPHIHGLAEAAVLGGASGAIVVDGVEALQPAVARLPQRMLVIRDQVVAGHPAPGGAVPSWDVSLNYVPIAYPALTPAVIEARAGRREFWRVLNASADTVADLHLSYDGMDQPLTVVGLDGVPTGSENGTRPGQAVSMTDILIPAGGRAEFVVTTPSTRIERATLETRAIPTGPAGDNEPARTLARIEARGAAGRGGGLGPNIPSLQGVPPGQAARGSDSLDATRVTGRRRLYFSEQGSDDANAATPIQFSITVAGEEPRPFDPYGPPAIVTTQDAIEEWTVENRTRETHEFHIHQVHFKLIRRNGFAVPPDQRQFLDTVQIPYWRGVGPYPGVSVLVDFRDTVPGDLLYHCHILQHEDKGMMAMVRVLPRPVAGRRAAG